VTNAESTSDGDINVVVKCFAMKSSRWKPAVVPFSIEIVGPPGSGTT